MKPLYIEAVGLTAAGLVGFEASKNTLQGGTYTPKPLDKYKPQILPPNERRRATQLVRLSFRAAEDAMTQSSISATDLATVFSSSDGDSQIVDQICQTIAANERVVSPTQFHNSVHNSAAGYWSIGAKSKHPSNSISAFDNSFTLGLLEAAGFVLVDHLPTLLVIYDTIPPALLQEKRQVTEDFACAFILTAKPTSQSIASIQLDITPLEPTTTVQHPDIRPLADKNPAARALPLIERLAKQQTDTLHVDLPQGQSLQIEVTPC